ncbi:hypothetical protein MTO96_003148 [Rhipicephalus appendiculatus]
MECLARFMMRTAPRALPLLRSRAAPRFSQVCGYKRSVPPMRVEMKARRKLAGPEPLRHRSVRLEWNYDAEIYAFARRLGETWSDSTLRVAFVQASYLEREKQQREELGMQSENADIGLTPNSDLSAAGYDLCKEPHERLAAVLQNSGRAPAEARLLWESGRNTLEATFCVGLYSDKQFLGCSAGETLTVAKEMAARDALRRFFGLSLDRNALSMALRHGQATQTNSAAAL